MKVLVIGANGRIGTRVVKNCVKKGIECRVLIRDKNQKSKFDELGAEAFVGNLHGNLSNVFQGCDTVVFSAGSGTGTGAEATLLIDLWGSIRAIEQAEKSGVKRFIMVSSLKANDPLRGPEKIQHYLVARNQADARLLGSSVPECTVLRPGRLLDEPATGKLNCKFDWNDKTNILSVVTRDDVAAVIVNVLESPLPTGTIVDFINGDTPIVGFMNSYRTTGVNKERGRIAG